MQQAEISYWCLPEALQDIFVRQRTGVLRVNLGESRERFLFLSGQLYLAQTNPFRDRMATILAGPPEGYEDPRFDPAGYLARELAAFVRDLGDEMAGWEVVDLHFEEPLGEVTEDLVGPVPTGVLVMDLCSRGLSESELLRRLGGLDTRYRAADSVMRRRFPELDAGETGMLDRLESTADIRTLIAEAGGRASEVLCFLTRLSSVRLVVSEADGLDRRGVLTQELLTSISLRVQNSLEARPLDLTDDAHRARLGKLLREYGAQTHFELLGVDGSSAVEEIHRGYMELARVAHPSHAEALGISGQKRRRRLEWLFSRLTEAYLVLTDPERAAEYRRGLSKVPVPPPERADTAMRRAERQRIARSQYELAMDSVATEDFHSAIELLRQAVRVDPRPEYHAQLGRCQMQNPKWLHMAVASLRKAVAMSPGDEELREELRRATEENERLAAEE